jgi:hypothetical protein
MPAPIEPNATFQPNQFGSPVAVRPGASVPFRAVWNLFSNTGGFASAWFSNSRFLDPQMVVRGTDDSAADIADGAKIHVLPTGGARYVRAFYRWVRDNASQPTITANNPRAYAYGFFPYSLSLRNETNPALSPTSSGFAQVQGGGIWLPLKSPTGLYEQAFDTTTIFRGADLGTSSTLANRNAQMLGSVEWLLEGATKLLILPSGAGAPTLSAGTSSDTDAQIIATFHV